MIRTLTLIVAGILATTAIAWGGADRYLDGKYITNGAATITVPTSTGTLLLTNGSGASLTGITATQVGLGNVTNDAQVKVSDFTAKGILLGGTGAGTYSGLTVGTNGQILSADSGEAAGLKWIDAPAVAPSVGGSTGSPTLITAVGGVAFTGTAWENVKFIAGNGGAVDVSANPQVAAATNVGQKLILIGTNDTDTVKLEDGTGLSLNGAWIAANHSVIGLMWDGSVWVEQYRR